MSSRRRTEQDANSALPGRPSLPALLSTVLLLMACCVQEGHSLGLKQQEEQHQQHSRRIPIAHGDGPRLRARSQQHLADWAVRERYRVLGKYGDIALGTSSLVEVGSKSNSNSNSRRSKPRKARRQFTAGTSIGTSRTSTSGVSAGSSTLTGSRASSAASATATAATTGLSSSSPSTSTIDGPVGRTNLTNYQSDL